MTSEAQVNSNKQNALSSTGPKTLAGKARSSQNALKHGILAKDLVIHDEKWEELEEFRQSICLALDPQGAMEELLVEKIINAAWRLRRVMKIEVSIFNKGDSFYGRTKLNDIFRGINGNCLHSLTRYESALERNLYKAIHELQRVQAMRIGHPVMTPIALDINLTALEESGFISQNESFDS